MAKKDSFEEDSFVEDNHGNDSFVEDSFVGDEPEKKKNSPEQNSSSLKSSPSSSASDSDGQSILGSIGADLRKAAENAPTVEKAKENTDEFKYDPVAEQQKLNAEKIEVPHATQYGEKYTSTHQKVKVDTLKDFVKQDILEEKIPGNKASIDAYSQKLKDNGYSDAEVDEVKNHAQNIASVAPQFREANAALKQNPDNPQASYVLGDSYLKMGDPKLAYNAYENVLKLPPVQKPEFVQGEANPQWIPSTYANALTGMGEAKAKMGDEETATKLYEQAYELDPQNSTALRGAAPIAFKQGNTELAKQLLLKAKEIEKSNQGYESGQAEDRYRRAHENDASQYMKDIADALTSYVTNVTPIAAVSHGVKSGIESLNESVRLFNQAGMEPENRAELLMTGQLKGMEGAAQTGLGVAMMTPEGAIFNLGMNTAEQILPEQLMQFISAPVSTALQYLDIKPGEAGKSLASFGDIIAQAFMMKAIHGTPHEKLMADKLIKNEPIKRDEWNSFLEMASGISDQDIAEATKLVNEKSVGEVKDKALDDLNKKKEDLQQAIQSAKTDEGKKTVQSELNKVEHDIANRHVDMVIEHHNSATEVVKDAQTRGKIHDLEQEVEGAPNKEVARMYGEKIEELKNKLTIKPTENAPLSESSTGKILQREPEETGSTGSERERVEPSQQGNETSQEGSEIKNEESIRQENEKIKKPQSEEYQFTHEAIQRARKAVGMDEVQMPELNKKADFEEAAKRYEEKPSEVNKIIAKSIQGGGGNRTEAFMVQIHKVALEKQRKKIMDKMEDAINAENEDKIKNLEIDQKINQFKIDNADDALMKMTSQAGQVLETAQGLIDEHGNLSKVLAKAHEYVKDGNLTDEQVAHFTKLQTDLDEVRSKLEKVHDQKSSESAKAELEKIKASIADQVKAGIEEEINKRYSKLATERKVKVDKAISFLDDLEKQILKSGNAYSTLIPPHIFVGAIKVIKLAIKGGAHILDAIDAGIAYIKEKHKDFTEEDEEKFRGKISEGLKDSGFEAELKNEKEPVLPTMGEDGKLHITKSTLKELVKNGHDTIEKVVTEVKKKFPDLTKREITDAISGYGKVREMETDPLVIKANELKSIAGMLSQKDVLESGELPLIFQKTLAQTDLQRELRRDINALKSELQKKLEAGGKSTEQMRTLLDALKRRITNKITDLEKQISLKEFKKRERAKTELDSEAYMLQKKYQLLKNQREKALFDLKQGTRSSFVKVIDGGLEFLRWWILAGFYGPFAKLFLGGATFNTFIKKPLETMLSSFYASKLNPLSKMRDLFNETARYGGKDQMKSLIDGAVKWYTSDAKGDFKAIWNNEPTEFKAKFGMADHETGYSNDLKDYHTYVDRIRGAWNIYHQALKAMPKGIELNIAYDRAMKFLVEKRDMNPADPMTQDMAAAKALQYAYREIYLNDNKSVDIIKQTVRGLAENEALVGKSLESQMLIIKVPSNIIAEAMTSAGGGLFSGFGAGLKADLAGELEKLTDEQREKIARSIVKVSAGAAYMGLGYYLFKQAGGLWDKNTKKEKDKAGLKSSDLKIGSLEIPHALQHNVLGLTLQIGAQLAWSQEYFKQHGESPAGAIGYAAEDDLFDVINENPIMRAAKNVVEFTEDAANKTKKKVEDTKGVIEHPSRIVESSDQTKARKEEQKIDKKIEQEQSTEKKKGTQLTEEETKTKIEQEQKKIIAEESLLAQAEKKGVPIKKLSVRKRKLAAERRHWFNPHFRDKLKHE